ncbi:NAD(P)H-binding protein [Spongiibacter sp.]|uniref:NAD(P)H-binding protein n=1 Tax=Spongiibacter sp. TaxID=2024860 RepID=UPI003562DED0
MKPATKKLLIIGCGDIGGGVASHYVAKGWQVQGLRRDISKLPPGVEGLAADLGDADSIRALGPLQADYVLMTLTPMSYRPEGYRKIFEEALATVMAGLQAPQHLLFVSSSGVYDQSGHDWVDEDSATEPSRFSGQSILKAEQSIAASAWPHSIVRFAGIYGPGRLQMIGKVRRGECVPDEPLHYSNRIHRDDCVGFLCHLIDRVAAGEPVEKCYLGVDDMPVAIQQVQRWLAEQLGVAYRQEGEPIARTGSKRCSNRRLRDSGYQLRHPDYRSGFAELLEEFKR